MTVDLNDPNDGRVVDPLGREWVTTARGAAQLGADVTEALIRDWRRRHLITPKIVRRRAWYDYAKLLGVEAATAGKTRPRTRVVDATPCDDPQSHSNPAAQNHHAHTTAGGR